MREVVIQANGLTKHYGETVAVDGLDLEVHRGEVYGLLGPNGSGKTTTILMLLGLVEPTGGQVTVLGYNPLTEPLDVKRVAGYMPDSMGFYDDLSARENLRYTAALAGMSRDHADRRIDEELEKMGLLRVAEDKVGTFSHGMKRRLGLAEVLVKQPGLIILDEPTSGLDPQAAREFLALIDGLREEGITVLLSSHLLHQVQAICDRVGLFHRGRKVMEGSVGELAEQVLGRSHRLQVEAEGVDVDAVLGGADGVASVSRVDGARYVVETHEDIRGEISQAISSAGGRLLSLSAERPGLDEVYASYFEEVQDEAARVTT
jgi:ABC-2 type transport system ATP-binding protein